MIKERIINTNPKKYIIFLLIFSICLGNNKYVKHRIKIGSGKILKLRLCKNFPFNNNLKALVSPHPGHGMLKR